MKRIKSISAAILAVTLTACGNTETETIIGDNNFLQNITESQTETETADEFTAAEPQSQTSSEQTAGTNSEGSPQMSEAQTERVPESSVQTSAEKPTEAPSPNVRENDTEKQIKILEEYYNKELKNITEYGGYNVIGVNAPQIYGFEGNSDFILLCEAAVRIEGDVLNRSITLCSTVDDSGKVDTQKIIDNTGGGVSYQSIEIKKCSVNDKFYCKYYQHGAEQISLGRYISLDGSEDLKISMFGTDRLFYVDGYSVTQSSYEEFASYLVSVMSEPVPTRTDGEISVYLPAPSNNNKISASAELVPPENFRAEVIDGSNIKFSWNGVSGDDITYTVYKVKNGKYTKVLDTKFTDSYSINGEKCDYCVAAGSSSNFIRESGYSNICTANSTGFDSYAAVDFIGASYADLLDYASNNGGYSQNIQVVSSFRLNGIPYELYGDLEQYETYGKTDYNYDYVRGLKVDEGERIAGDIVFNKNAVKNLAKKYGQTTAVTKVYGDSGDLTGVGVEISISENISVTIIYKIPLEKDYEDKYKAGEITYDELNNYYSDKYLKKNHSYR